MDSKNKFRLYVDETGNSDYPRRLDAEVGRRYLALTGIAISDYEYNHVLRSKIDEMKYLITGDYDEKITLHRDEIKDRKGVYAALLDKTVEKLWNKQMQNLISETDFTLFCVVIDKVEHKKKYPQPNHPYYYCLEVLLERYYKFLNAKNGRGDVMFESRGKKEDSELKRQYSRIYEFGTRFVSARAINSKFTSKDIKLKNKESRIEGLELADVLALATKLDTLALYGRIDHVASKFMKDLLEWVSDKYDYSGRKGYGRKLLP